MSDFDNLCKQSPDFKLAMHECANKIYPDETDDWGDRAMIRQAFYFGAKWMFEKAHRTVEQKELELKKMDEAKNEA